MTYIARMEMRYIWWLWWVWQIVWTWCKVENRVRQCSEKVFASTQTVKTLEKFHVIPLNLWQPVTKSEIEWHIYRWIRMTMISRRQIQEYMMLNRVDNVTKNFNVDYGNHGDDVISTLNNYSFCIIHSMLYNIFLCVSPNPARFDNP